jgi:hypothetical protein
LFDKLAENIKRIGEMARGGFRSGAGRPKGAKNRRTRLQEEASKQALKGGITPLEFLLGIMRDENEAKGVRMAAAKAALPYCHPRLSATHIVGDEQVSHEDWLTRLAEDLDGQDVQVETDFVTPSVTLVPEISNQPSPPLS